MENPATWGKAERLIHEKIVNHEYQRRDGHVVIGLSLARQIADALRAAGLLTEDDHG